MQTNRERTERNFIIELENKRSQTPIEPRTKPEKNQNEQRGNNEK